MAAEPDIQHQASQHQDNPTKGMMYAVWAFFIFSVMNVFAKMLSEHHHVIEVAFYRNLIATLPFLVIIWGMGRKEILTINTSPNKVVARAIIGTISLVATFGAYSLLPMADATAFLFTSSLLVPAFGFFFLKEYVGPFRWSAIIIGFIGVLIMLRPTGDVNFLGTATALSAAFMHATLQTILRSLGKTEKPETVTFYFVFIGTFIALIPMPLVFTMPTWHEVPLILATGIAGVIAQYLLSNAYKLAPASIVTVFNYTGIIWATLFGWLIWNEWPVTAIWIGGSIVVASNIFIVLREHRLAKARIANVKVHKADTL